MPRSGGKAIPLGPGAAPVWSPDGLRLAFVSDRGGALRVWTSDAEGRERVEIKDAAVANPLVTWLPDGRLAWQTQDARNYRIRDLVTGQDELLRKEPAQGFVFVPRFSPKGNRVAVYENRPDARGLWILSWPEREESFLAPNLYPDGWSPDGEWIYGHQSGSATIVKVSLRNGRVQTVATFPAEGLTMDACDLSSNGQALVCSLADVKADAWLIENFDPRGRTQAR